MTISAGELDRKVSLQSFTTTQNDYNEDVQAWSTYANDIWAKKEFHTSVEGEASGRQYADMGLYFTIRWRAGVSAEHRLIYKNDAGEDEPYRIVGRPREIERRKFLKIQVSLVE